MKQRAEKRIVWMLNGQVSNSLYGVSETTFYDDVVWLMKVNKKWVLTSLERNTSGIDILPVLEKHTFAVMFLDNLLEVNLFLLTWSAKLAYHSNGIILMSIYCCLEHYFFISFFSFPY